MASAWLAALVIFALSGFIAWQDWRDDRTKAEISVLNTAQVLADQTENLFDQINALLNSVGDRYATLRESGNANATVLPRRSGERCPTIRWLFVLESLTKRVPSF
jgi:predicted negative regulator of RcsB-dependent stress response